MNNGTLIMGLITVMVLVLGVFAVRQKKKQMEIQKKHPGHPKGYWTSQGMGTGVAIGVAIGATLENVAIRIAIGGQQSVRIWRKNTKMKFAPSQTKKKS